MRRPVAAAVVAPLVAVWVVRLVRLLGSRLRCQAYWSRPRGSPGGLLYVALGDSAAQGVGASRPSHGYVGLLAQRLRDRTGRPVQVVNLSRSGAHLRDVLRSQLPALAALGRRPDVVTLAVGGNDLLSFDRAAFAEQAGRLLAALPAGTYVADAPYFMHGHWERDAQRAARLLTRGAVAAGLRPVALHAALRAQGWQAMLTQFAADWFHPNDRGHAVWADAFWREMRDDPALAAVSPFRTAGDDAAGR